MVERLIRHEAQPSALETTSELIISVVYLFVAIYTGFEKSARRGFFSNVGGMNSQEDTASAVSPGLLVNLVDVYERKRCLNWIYSGLTYRF